MSRAARIDPDPDGERRRAARARLGLEDAPPVRRPRRRRPLRALRALLLGVFAAALLSLLPVVLLRYVDPPLTALMLGEWLDATRTGDSGFSLDRQWRPLKAMSPLAAAAVIAAEDQKFRAHHGFDFEAISAVLAARDAGAPLRGASTITQQVAKNLFLWRGRHWVRKGLEAWFTIWLEVLWSKDRILEIYLNVAQFGRGVYGVEAASRRYFGHGANALDAPEAALLAGALPNPVHYRVDAPNRGLRRRQDWILRQMRQLGLPR